VERFYNELNDVKAALSLLKEEASDKKRTEIKSRESFIRKLTAKVSKLNNSITQRENNFIFQQQLVKSLTQKKNVLHQQNSTLTAKLLHQTDLSNRTRSKMQLQAQSTYIMYKIASSLVTQFLQREVPENSLKGHHVVRLLYRDLFKNHIIAMNAAIRLQSWFRGVQARRGLLRDGFYTILTQNKKRFAEVMLYILYSSI
jgi:hypothetical protein